MEYILYCDESKANGRKFSDFFGGCLVDGRYVHEIEETLNNKKRELNLNGELKWTKVTASYLNKYIEIMSLFFKYVNQGKIKVRIMFRENDRQPVYRNADEKYFKLYYQFIKHAFGLKFMPGEGSVYVRIYLDQLPDKKEKCDKFKSYIRDIPNLYEYHESPICIREGDIAEVSSHDHVILQCVDIVLGAMQFRLNEGHKYIEPGKHRRGKKTIAKEKLYKHILSEIRKIHKNFNIGISTGYRSSDNPSWEHAYSHWKFISRKEL